jgi:hypothetical protein
MLPTMPSAMTQESTGSAILYTSTGSFVALPPLGRNTGVYVAGDTCTTKLDLHAGQTGRETTHSPFVVTVEFSDVRGFILSCWIFLEDIFVTEFKILENFGTCFSIWSVASQVAIV